MSTPVTESSTPTPLFGRRRSADASAAPDKPLGAGARSDRRLALVSGVATGCWVAVLAALRSSGVAVVAVALLMTVFFVTASVWLALAATRSRIEEPTTLTRVAASAGTASVLPALITPMLVLMSTGGGTGDAALRGMVDALTTTALVMLPLANVVADRQARALGKAQARTRESLENRCAPRDSQGHHENLQSTERPAEALVPVPQTITH